MLGQPLTMLVPPVVGLRLTGELPEGTTATDLVLTIAELLRHHGVVGKFVEVYGPGLAQLPLENRATIGNMAPEYGATCVIFPIDDVTLDYLRFTGRDDDARGPGRGLRQGAGAVPRARRSRARCSPSSAELDLSTVEPSLAGPVAAPGPGVARRTPSPASAGHWRRRRRDGADRSRRFVRWTPRLDGGGHAEIADGHVVIAAITSCTNTSNPQVMLAAGLLAQKAVARGLRLQAVGEDLAGAGVARRHGLLRAGRTARPVGDPRFPARRVRVHDLHRQLGPAPARRVRGRARGGPVRGRGAVGQPQLRRPHPPRRPAELPGVTASGRGVRAGGDHGPRPHLPSRSAPTATAHRSTCATSGPRRRRCPPPSNRR